VGGGCGDREDYGVDKYLALIHARVLEHSSSSLGVYNSEGEGKEWVNLKQASI
jgi:hypothetical protein